MRKSLKHMSKKRHGNNDTVILKLEFYVFIFISYKNNCSKHNKYEKLAPVSNIEHSNLTFLWITEIVN